MSIAKQIQDYSDYYVSSAGNVWREKSNESYLRLRPNKIGRVGLCTNGKHKFMFVYRLVAQEFVPVPSEYANMSVDELEVHHINFNHNDNRASNLQWLTKAEHMQLHSKSEVTSFRKSEANKEQSKSVAQYAKDGEFVAEYTSTMEAQRRTNIAQGHICECCRGKRNSAGGYIWKYI